MDSIRRIVTGHDETGKAVFVEDADSPRVETVEFAHRGDAPGLRAPHVGQDS